jgi:hypothetical protein
LRSADAGLRGPRARGRVVREVSSLHPGGDDERAPGPLQLERRRPRLLPAPDHEPAAGVLLLMHTSAAAARGFTLLCQDLGRRLVEAAEPLLSAALLRDSMPEELSRVAAEARRDPRPGSRTVSPGPNGSPTPRRARRRTRVSSSWTAGGSSGSTTRSAMPSATSSCEGSLPARRERGSSGPRRSARRGRIRHPARRCGRVSGLGDRGPDRVGPGGGERAGRAEPGARDRHRDGRRLRPRRGQAPSRRRDARGEAAREHRGRLRPRRPNVNRACSAGEPEQATTCRREDRGAESSRRTSAARGG